VTTTAPTQPDVADVHAAVLAATRLARVGDYRLVFNENGVVATSFTGPGRIVLRLVEPQSPTGETFEVNHLDDSRVSTHLFSTRDLDRAVALFAVLAHREAARIEVAARELFGHPDARLHVATTYLAEWWSGGIADFIASVSLPQP